MNFKANKFSFIRQLDSQDCGLACLSMVCKHYGVNMSINDLKATTIDSRQGLGIQELSRIASTVGFDSHVGKISLENIKELRDGITPAILYWSQNHYVVLYKIKKEKFYVADPNIGKQIFAEKDFCQKWLNANDEVEKDLKEGYVLLLTPNNSLPQKTRMHSEIDFIKVFIKENYIKYKKYIAVIIATFFIGAIYQLSIPFITKILLDRGIPSKRMYIVWIIIVSQFLLNFGGALTQYLRSWFILHIGTRIGNKLIERFLIKLLKLPLHFFDSKTVGDYLQRFEDNNRISIFIATKLLKGSFSLFQVIITNILLIFVKMDVGLIFLIFTVLQIFWIGYFTMRKQSLDHLDFSNLAAERLASYELLSGISDIKLNTVEAKKINEYLTLKEQGLILNVKKLKLDQIENGGADLMLFIQTSITLAICSVSVLSDVMTVGTMITIVFITGTLQVPIRDIIDLVANSQIVSNSLSRVIEILRAEEEINEDKGLLQLPEFSNLNIRNLSFGYQSNRPILKGINLIIPKGKITAIVGESGSGKTTLLKLILQMYKPQLGSIIIGDTNLDNINLGFWRKTCGAVLQDSFIFSDTIGGNIALSNTYDFSKLKESAAIANIHEFIESLPKKYDTKIGNDGISLSQGQKQRILIARAVYKNPDFIFFDEATNSLDSRNELIVMRNLEKFFAERTVIIIAHRLSTVRNANQIIVLDSGEVLEKGTHDELINLKGKYFSLIKNQLELDG